MNEIDLFPNDMRRQLMYRRWFQHAGFTLVGLSLAIVAAHAWLDRASDRYDEEIRHFQSQREISTANRHRLEQLSQQKSDLQQQLDLLSGLRSGASAEQMFVMLDRALPGPEVWLTQWKFRRAGTPVDDAPDTYSSGYFIVVPADSQVKKEETWKIETQMNILGQALDHAAMSKFVLNLTRQPEIEDVRIVSTRQSEVNGHKIVDFSLDIVVSARQEGD